MRNSALILSSVVLFSAASPSGAFDIADRDELRATWPVENALSTKLAGDGSTLFRRGQFLGLIA